MSQCNVRKRSGAFSKSLPFNALLRMHFHWIFSAPTERNQGGSSLLPSSSPKSLPASSFATLAFQREGSRHQVCYHGDCHKFKDTFPRDNDYSYQSIWWHGKDLLNNYSGFEGLTYNFLWLCTGKITCLVQKWGVCVVHLHVACLGGDTQLSWGGDAWLGRDQEQHFLLILGVHAPGRPWEIPDGDLQNRCDDDLQYGCVQGPQFCCRNQTQRTFASERSQFQLTWYQACIL